MKTKQALAAIGLSAALALGAMPMTALAEDPTVPDQTPPEPTAPDPTDATAFEYNKADTQVSVITNASQLSATIPLKMSIVAKSVGGDIIAPSKTKYVVKNNSMFDVYITSIEGVAQTGWGLVETDPAATVSTKDYGDLMLKINGKKLGFEQPDADHVTSFTVGKANDADTPGKLELEMTGTCSPLNKISAEALGVHAVTATYTISASAPTNPTPDPGPTPDPNPEPNPNPAP